MRSVRAAKRCRWRSPSCWCRWSRRRRRTGRGRSLKGRRRRRLPLRSSARVPRPVSCLANTVVAQVALNNAVGVKRRPHEFLRRRGRLW